MLKFQKADENQKEISISELKNIKGFWEPTIAKLKDNWINTIQELKKFMEGKSPQQMGEILNPVQYKQAKNYFIDNPYEFL